MFREQRNSPAGQRTVHGKSNQLPSAEAGSPIANENASPNHASNERIKAWKGMKTSGIPSAPSPSLEAVAVTPKQVPVGVTPVNERVSTLQAIKNHLQDRLESERQLQIDAVKQLEYIGSGDEVGFFLCSGWPAGQLACISTVCDTVYLTIISLGL